MTIQQAIAQVDEMKPNMMSTSLKVAKLNEIESIIHDEIVMAHEHTQEQAVPPNYDDATDPGTVLILKAPDDVVYVYWLMCEIDKQNMEYDKYNNDKILFQDAYDEATNRWTRLHMPVQRTGEFII